MSRKDTTLADLKKTIPPGGLMNPGLRKMTPMDPAKLKAQIFPGRKKK